MHTQDSTPTSAVPDDAPQAPMPAGGPEHPHRYTAQLAGQIERRWQDEWEQRGTFHAPNPTGPLTGPDGENVDPDVPWAEGPTMMMEDFRRKG